MGQSKIDRTNEFETAVKTAIMNNMVAEDIQEMTEDLRQKKFDKLVKQGIIVATDHTFDLRKSEAIEVDVEDMSPIFDPMNGINWITT